MLHLKEKFMMRHFNVFSCQFVVKEDGDYTIHNIDPDKLVEWDSVELIVSYCQSFSYRSSFSLLINRSWQWWIKCTPSCISSPFLQWLPCRGMASLKVHNLIVSSDLIFVRFKAEFRFFYSGFYRYDSFFIVYSKLPIADFHFLVVLVKSGLYLKSGLIKEMAFGSSGFIRGRLLYSLSIHFNFFFFFWSSI